MRGRGWRLEDSLAQLLAPNEREAVLGDIMEAGQRPAQALGSLCGLLLRRQAAYWSDWRPWLAAFGLAFPCSFLLMGFSVTLSLTSLQFIHRATPQTASPGVSLLLSNLLLLIAWSWTGGFVMGSVSRRTLWVSAVLALLPCCFCLTRFRIEGLSRFCLLLFLPPAIHGVHRGSQTMRITLRSAMLLASATTLLTISMWISTGPSLLNPALTWPAWYLVGTARRSRQTREQYGD